jgi:hypothetical protein
MFGMKPKEIKPMEIISTEKKNIDYEINNLYEMVESAPKDIEYNLKYAKGIYRRLAFLCTIKNREGEIKNAE